MGKHERSTLRRKVEAVGIAAAITLPMGTALGVGGAEVVALGMSEVSGVLADRTTNLQMAGRITETTLLVKQEKQKEIVAGGDIATFMKDMGQRVRSVAKEQPPKRNIVISEDGSSYTINRVSSGEQVDVYADFVKPKKPKSADHLLVWTKRMDDSYPVSNSISITKQGKYWLVTEQGMDPRIDHIEPRSFSTDPKSSEDPLTQDVFDYYAAKAKKLSQKVLN